jgi:hypothetical protein
MLALNKVIKRLPLNQQLRRLKRRRKRRRRALRPLRGAVRPHHRNSSNGVRPAATKSPSHDWVDRLGLVVARVAWGRSHARIASRRERAFLVSKVWPTMCQATELTSRALQRLLKTCVRKVMPSEMPNAYLSLTRLEKSGFELGGKAAFALTPRRRSSATCSARSSFLSPGT